MESISLHAVDAFPEILFAEEQVNNYEKQILAAYEELLQAEQRIPLLFQPDRSTEWIGQAEFKLKYQT